MSNGLLDLAAFFPGSLPGTYSTSSDGGASQDLTAWAITSLTPAPVPLPATAWLLTSGFGGLVAFRKGAQIGRARPGYPLRVR